VYIYIIEREKGDEIPYKATSMPHLRDKKVARKEHTHNTQTLFTRNWPF